MKQQPDANRLTRERNPGTIDEIWKSNKVCYEGDGDIIDTEEGSVEPTFLDIGTILKNMPFALDPTVTPGILQTDNPYCILFRSV